MTSRPLAAVAAGVSFALFGATAAAQTVFINEIHYDNTGTDAGEAIEIAGPAGTDLSGWELVLYNGSNGGVYRTDALSGVIPDEASSGFGVVVQNYPVNGIQNGSPDGIALVDDGGVVVQFLSYEGTITAADGPAIGLMSTDIGVSEPGTTAVGDSLHHGHRLLVGRSSGEHIRRFQHGPEFRWRVTPATATAAATTPSASTTPAGGHGLQ